MSASYFGVLLYEASSRPTVTIERPAVVWTGPLMCFGDVRPQDGAALPRKSRVDRDPLPWFDVWCTHCGEIERVDIVNSRSGSLNLARTIAGITAHRHAEVAHDGDVFREGWV